MRIEVMFGFVVIFGLMGVVLGGEWVTSRGEFCIDECKYREDSNFFYWCHTVDGQSQVYRPSHGDSWENDERGEEADRHKRWDYCTPSRKEDDEGKTDNGEDGSRPNHGGRGRREVDPSQAKNTSSNGNFNNAWSNEGDGTQGGNWGTNGWNNQGNQGGNWENQGGHNEGFNEGQGVAHTSLYHQTDCLGQCYNSGGRSICDTKTDHPLAQGTTGNKWFYCSPNVPLRREQISAEKRLWCTSPCSKMRGEDYTCSTMFGKDKCSPAPDLNSKGKKCHGSCQLHDSIFETYYFCYIDAQKSNYEKCGYHDVDQDLKHRLEFTESSTTPSVCADNCQWNDPELKDYKSCNIVKWDWNSTSQESTLRRSWDYCEGFYAPPTSGTTIAIVIGCIVGVIVILVVVGWSVKKVNYRRAATSDSA